MRVAFVYIKGRAARLAEVRRGAAATEFFYGAIELERRGWTIEQFEIDPDARDIAARILAPLLRFECGPVKTQPQILTQSLILARQLNRCDCIVATGGNIAFSAAALAAVGLMRRPIIGIQCGVLNYHHNAVRFRLSRALLLQTHTVLFGDSELEPMRRFFDLPADAISVNQFGVDTEFWTSGDHAAREDFVLSVGNDGHRDYETLLKAAPLIRAPIRIVTRRELPAPLPPNVTVLKGDWHGRALSDCELRELYRGARCVVVPVRPTFQPSGQSVALQAMACGAPVVITETDGLWSREVLADGVNVRLARVSDAADLAAKVNGVLSDGALAETLARNGREMVCSRGNIADFARRIGTLCERVTRGERGAELGQR